MKIGFFLILFFCVANSYCQIITTDKLIGTWISYNVRHWTFIYNFIDSSNLNISESHSGINKDCTYKIKTIMLALI